MNTFKELLLEQMLAGVTPEIVGGELDWGPDVGAELLVPEKEWPEGYLGSQRDIWQSIDPASYLEDERNAW